MRDKFIRFCKDIHFWDEYIEEVDPSIDMALKSLEDGGESFMLQDGTMFFHKDAKTKVDWAAIDKEWTEICYAEARAHV